MIPIAVLGHGVVGSGVAELLLERRDALRKKTGKDIALQKIFDIRTFPSLSYADKFTSNIRDVLDDPHIRVVVEAMGGITPAFDYVSAALKAGKSVVTSNKELVAARGTELLALARARDQNFLFEASVGGGIPILRALHESMVPDPIDEIVGILNGTTNFILTKMIREDVGFDDALQMAQRLGYAEADPSADVEGLDTCRKICILASMAFGCHMDPGQVHAEGIAGITLEDVHYAESEGFVVKLLGETRMSGGRCYVTVGPALVSAESPLADVDDVFNAVLVRSAIRGDLLFTGKGAGKQPTAAAVVGDIVECALARGHIPTLEWVDCGRSLADWKEQPAIRYVRCQGPDARAQIAGLFGEDACLLHRTGKPSDEEAFLTPFLAGHELDARLERLSAAGIRILSDIRVWGR